MKFDEKQSDIYIKRTRRSKQLGDQAKTIIPTGHAGGLGSFLPEHPIVLERGEGSRVWDVDGNEYVDLRLGDWALIHGHADPHARHAVYEQMGKLSQVGAQEHDCGYRMARLLVDRVPSMDKVRFFVSGTDANVCAVRLARAFTGRDRIARSVGGYHGTADALTVGVSVLRSAGDLLPDGIPAHSMDEIVSIPYNDADGAEKVLREHATELAAVLIEPVMSAAGMIESQDGYLQRLRSVTSELGILLIFDEVVTFAVAYGGAQAHYGVTPDLTTLGKVVGGGLPVSAVGGRADVMDLLEPDVHGGKAPVVMKSTFGGNSAALAAGISCLERLTPEVHAVLSAKGDRVRSFVDELGRKYGIPLHATGLGNLIGLHWGEDRVVDDATRRREDREKVQNINLALDNEGFYQTFTGLFLISTVISDEEVDAFLRAFERTLHTLRYVSRS